MTPWPGSRSASSTVGLSAKTLPLRQAPSVVMTSVAPASSMRPRRLEGLNPPKTAVWIAPMRAQASIAADRLRQHRQVDRDAIAGLDAERLEHVREPLHLGGHVGVGDRAGVARLALPVQGDAVAVAGLHVPVEAVDGHVQRAVVEPPRVRRLPVEHLGERRLPLQLARLLRPEPEAVLARPPVELSGRAGRPRERLRWREAAGLVQQMVDAVRHSSSSRRRRRRRAYRGLPSRVASCCSHPLRACRLRWAASARPT